MSPVKSILNRDRRRREELRGVIRMSVPIVITLCSRMFMDIADFAMISRMPEGAVNAQGAILPAQITVWSFIVFGMATAGIVNTFVSQSLGRGRLRDTSAYAWQGVYLGWAYGIVVSAAVWPLLPALFAWIGHDAAIQEQELIYARIAILTMGGTIAAEALSGFFNGIHRPTVTMWSAIEANLLNVVLSYILIYGAFGLPAMGIAGAAWGTFIGVSYRFVRLLASFLFGHYAQAHHTRETYRLNGGQLRAIMMVGSPQGLQATSDVVVWAVFANILIGRLFSRDDLIASNIVWNYLRLAFMPTFGIGIALSAMVGKAVGQGDPGLAIRITRITLGIVIAYLLCLSAVYVGFREALIGLFLTEPAPQVVAIGSTILICAVFFITFDGIGIAYHFALKGAGDTFWPAVLLIVSHWVIVVGGGYATAMLFPDLGSLGPWLAATVLLVFLSVALGWRWRSRAWQRIDIFRHEGAGDAAAPPFAVRTQSAAGETVVT